MERGGLSSTIPSVLGQLTNLYFIDLDYNALTGTLPPEISRLTALEQLDLNNNRLTGSIDVIAPLTKVFFLQLHQQLLHGDCSRASWCILAAWGGNTSFQSIRWEHQPSNLFPPRRSWRTTHDSHCRLWGGDCLHLLYWVQAIDLDSKLCSAAARNRCFQFDSERPPLISSLDGGGRQTLLGRNLFIFLPTGTCRSIPIHTCRMYMNPTYRY